jgi:hypothetical protein
MGNDGCHWWENGAMGKWEMVGDIGGEWCKGLVENGGGVWWEIMRGMGEKW